MKIGTTVLFVGLLVVGVTLGVHAKIRVHTQHDKTVDLRGFRTYAWHPDGAGEVKILASTGDDPQAIRGRLEPVIRQAVEAQLATRGFTPASSAPPDVYVNYYLLLSAGTSDQSMGQFLPAMPEWGLPPFQGATTSLRIYEQGSLVLDVIVPSLKTVVWRGVARTEVDRTRTPAEREKRIRDGVREMLKRFPPKP